MRSMYMYRRQSSVVAIKTILHRKPSEYGGLPPSVTSDYSFLYKPVDPLVQFIPTVHFLIPDDGVVTPKPVGPITYIHFTFLFGYNKSPYFTIEMKVINKSCFKSISAYVYMFLPGLTTDALPCVDHQS